MSVVPASHSFKTPGNPPSTLGSNYERHKCPRYTMTSGIYRIRNIINQHVYIGSSWDVNSRHAEHFRDLRAGHHPNKHLQSAWNKYGGEAFVFELVELCTLECLIEREQHHIDTCKPEYNIKRVASVRGFPKPKVKPARERPTWHRLIYGRK